LQIGTAALASCGNLDLKLFVETANQFGPLKLTKGGRLTLSVDHVFNTGQLLRNSAGITWQNFQPI
jgi:hypothetical protein